MRKIGIISDDLTGANDSGVQLTEKGLTTSVFFDLPTGEVELDEAIVINTDSRSLSVEEAVNKSNLAANFLKHNDYQYIYKKMDSTIRGHIAREIEAIYKEIQPEYVFVAPAFPALERTTVDGSHYLKEEKIENTEISNDPVHPVTKSHIPTIFSDTIDVEMATLTLDDLRNGFEKFNDKITKCKEAGISYLVCDAVEESDLELAAKYMVELSNNILWAGSAGLAEVLPEVLGISNLDSQRRNIQANQVLTICGSLSSVTQKQIKYAIAQENIESVEVDTVQIFDGNWSEYSKRIVQMGRRILSDYSDLVIYLPSNEDVRKEAKRKGLEQGFKENQISNIISEEVSSLAYQIIKENQNVNGLVLTGGDTAKDTAVKLGGIGIQLIKQIETGIPLGTLIGPSEEYFVVTKAGAFGRTGSIYNAMMELKGVLRDE
ncbi:hypothetical protein WN59_04720 [Salinicoccus sediminis]|uniref:Hrp-dependent type III effector protein n=1 Tax=Salinicoccus sediminis TaxID=1432562 RepID=A0A0M2SJU5_9STAP|nr:four-carbon acid sugar kinase family protein [Salinicoccus sediminis]KKK34954.1 hypothetical protein WN59_04720 [Salinicoccus sediminis]